ncbi:MAG TPA: DUF732 domain-containing protein [Mycobacterium sp.]|nr:DUF732 domain-containing protein [Mycobacterium sp.]
MQQPVFSAAGRPERAAFDPRATATLVPSVLVTATVAILLSGCSSGDDVATSTTAPPGAQTATRAPEPGESMSAPASSNVVVTPHQHGYLDALAAAGVHRSSDLRALSIGSYVCQARAAGQTDQAVWDFVMPLVRSDIHDSAEQSSSHDPAARSLDDVTAEYIRIATDRLC